MLFALHTPGMPEAVRMMASLKTGSARSPMSSSFDSLASNAATAARMSAMASEATPSQRVSPDSTAAAVPAAAAAMPKMAAESSNTTMKLGGSLERRKASHQLQRPMPARKARMPITQEAPSKASDSASTMKMTADRSMGRGCRMRPTPSYRDTPAPSAKISSATTKLQK